MVKFEHLALAFAVTVVIGWSITLAISLQYIMHGFEPMWVVNASVAFTIAGSIGFVQSIRILGMMADSYQRWGHL